MIPFINIYEQITRNFITSLSLRSKKRGKLVENNDWRVVSYQFRVLCKFAGSEKRTIFLNVRCFLCSGRVLADLISCKNEVLIT